MLVCVWGGGGGRGLSFVALGRSASAPVGLLLLGWVGIFWGTLNTSCICYTSTHAGAQSATQTCTHCIIHHTSTHARA